MTLVDATYTAFIVPLGVAFHFKAIHFSWYNALDIAAGKFCWFSATCATKIKPCSALCEICHVKRLHGLALSKETTEQHEWSLHACLKDVTRE